MHIVHPTTDTRNPEELAEAVAEHRARVAALDAVVAETRADLVTADAALDVAEERWRMAVGERHRGSRALEQLSDPAVLMENVWDSADQGNRESC